MRAKRPVVVCDVDGTLFRSSLLMELVEELVRRQIFPSSIKKVYADADEDWQNKKGEYGSLIRKVLDAFAFHAKGIAYGEIADVAGELIEANRDYVYHYTRDLLKDLKSKGYYLLAISHSPKFIVDGFAYEHGFDKSYGVFFETGAAGRFSGDIADEHLIMNKRAILDRALEKEKLSLAGSVGVGTNESDITMLDILESPIAFNPNRVLYRHAKKKSWELVVEKKHVIYEL